MLISHAERHAGDSLANAKQVQVQVLDLILLLLLLLRLLLVILGRILHHRVTTLFPAMSRCC